ncbi:MAG: hypothetical protein WAT79_07080 [Saprospiraceae bacterium]
MELSNIIFGVIVVSTCLSPFIYFYILLKKKQNQKIQAFNNLAKASDSEAGIFEILEDFIIGMDKENRKVFIIQFDPKEVKQTVVELYKVQKCHVVSSFKTVGVLAAQQTILDKLVLKFESKNKNVDDVMVEIFDLKTSMQQNGEQQLAEKWSKLINESLIAVKTSIAA